MRFGISWAIPSITNCTAIAQRISPIVLDTICIPFLLKILKNHLDKYKADPIIAQAIAAAKTIKAVVAALSALWEYKMTVVIAPGPKNIGVATGIIIELKRFVATENALSTFTVSIPSWSNLGLPFKMRKPIIIISIPPAILNAGIVIPNNESKGCPVK